jgi:anti-sigma-K factor RskA
MTTDPRDRLLDLLAAEATQGLTEDEVRELRGLLLAFPDEDPDSIAHAAAAADLALSGPPAPLPPALAAQIERQAKAFFANAPEPAPPPRPPRTPRSTYLAWAVAAGLAAVLLWTQWPKPPVRVQTPEALAEALRKLPDSKEFSGEKAGATGEIVWNTAKQEGVISVKGLPALDPTKEQYQLWIVDGGQKHPIDGGVFDVKPDGNTTITVNAKLKVKDPKAFAITREVAGGVVVTEKKLEEMNLVLAPKT